PVVAAPYTPARSTPSRAPAAPSTPRSQHTPVPRPRRSGLAAGTGVRYPWPPARGSGTRGRRLQPPGPRPPRRRGTAERPGRPGLSRPGLGSPVVLRVRDPQAPALQFGEQPGRPLRQRQGPCTACPARPARPAGPTGQARRHGDDVAGAQLLWAVGEAEAAVRPYGHPRQDHRRDAAVGRG